MDLAKKYLTSLEEIACNSCGADKSEVLCERERFGLPLQTVICKDCGLIYINPRPTKESYTEFYKSDYRKIISGSDEWDPAKFEEQISFANRIIIPLLDENIPGFMPESILDLGTSYGGILHALIKRYPGSEGTGLEPLVKIGEYAQQITSATIHTSLFEDYDTDQQFDLIVFPRSLNHSLDPFGNLSKIRSLLSDNGVFVLTIYDAVTELLHKPLEEATELTHPYIFTPETIHYMFDQVGLSIIGYEDEALDARYMSRHDFRKVTFSNMRLVARKGAASQLKLSKPDYSEIVLRINANQRAYEKYVDFIEKWRRNPTFLMRGVRKILRILKIW